VVGYRSDVASRDRPSAAEGARTIAASTNSGTLATLGAGGEPWASFVTYGLLAGAPVLCVSTLAEHGRNLAADQRASISIVSPSNDPDPQAWARVTLAGVADRPVGDELAAARHAHLSAVPGAAGYLDFADFTLWVLRVSRVRWYGGYGQMDVATDVEYAAAEPDPVAPNAARAVAHLNADHAESLLDMAKNLAGYPDATSATCTGADRYGLALTVDTPRGLAYTRVSYPNPLESPADLRSAATELAERARIGG
jgi:heme iron utilization protein